MRFVLDRWLGSSRVLAVLLVGVMPAVGLAFTLKTLIMPGRVIEAHANIEEDCENCHEESENESQNDLCFVCHTEVRADVADGVGFHGRHPEARAGDCYTCHAEHEGRDAKIAAFDARTFEHIHTDLPLEGAHAQLPCTQCHVESTAFRDAPNQCIDCHKSDDVHMGTLPACATCHTSTAWLQTSFDHSRTRFVLTGAHETATCTACHADNVFAGVRRECTACHRGDDVHAGRNGEQCGSCHSSVAWQLPNFDHARKTGFALLGSHATTTCEACHVTNLATALPSTCNGCHRADDPHGGRLGESCGDCHGPNHWSATEFNHAAVTDFLLRGAHADLQCTTCHVDGLTASLGKQCASCHAEDPHQMQLGERCESCHSETGWHAAVRFDHDLVPFPLLGKHRALECDACHASAAFHDAGSACVDCHAGADAHGGRFGQDCATCHNPQDWHAWVFDHAGTGFQLTGAHATVSCAACHEGPAARMDAAPSACGQCHRPDDPHGSEFGADCASCHTTDSFGELRGR